jgi:hypothetical protein
VQVMHINAPMVNVFQNIFSVMVFNIVTQMKKIVMLRKLIQLIQKLDAYSEVAVKYALKKDSKDHCNANALLDIIKMVFRKTQHAEPFKDNT